MGKAGDVKADTGLAAVGCQIGRPVFKLDGAVEDNVGGGKVKPGVAADTGFVDDGVDEDDGQVFGAFESCGDAGGWFGGKQVDAGLKRGSGDNSVGFDALFLALVGKGDSGVMIEGFDVGNGGVGENGGAVFFDSPSESVGDGLGAGLGVVEITRVGIEIFFEFRGLETEGEETAKKLGDDLTDLDGLEALIGPVGRDLGWVGMPEFGGVGFDHDLIEWKAKMVDRPIFVGFELVWVLGVFFEPSEEKTDDGVGGG